MKRRLPSMSLMKICDSETSNWSEVKPPLTETSSTKSLKPPGLSIFSGSTATSTGGWNCVRPSASSGPDGSVVFSAGCSGLSVVVE